MFDDNSRFDYIMDELERISSRLERHGEDLDRAVSNIYDASSNISNTRVAASATAFDGNANSSRRADSEPASVTGSLTSLFSEDRRNLVNEITNLNRDQISTLRRELSQLKTLQAAGGLPQSVVREISSVIGESLSKLKDRRAELAEESLTATPERRQEIAIALRGTDELISALKNQQNAVSESTDKMGRTIGNMVASVIGSLAVQQYIMMRTVQQPYQYQTLPALGAMGTTGLMGEALSGAYGAQESVLQSYRGMTMQTSMTLGGGLGLLAGGNPAMRAALALGGTLAGAGIGSLLKDPMADFLSAGMDEKAFNMELGRRILNPQSYAQDFFLPTLQARMGFGLGLGEETAAEELSSLGGRGAQALGYNAAVSGQILGSYLSTLSPDLIPQTREEQSQLIDRTAQLESFGMSKDAIFGVMSEISRAGSEDYDRSLGRLLLATSENGEITNFTANVLVPALSKVIESRSIQNIAKSSEQVEKETAGLFSFFKNSDTNLGKILSANPEMMNQVFGMLNQVGETALQDPALMLYLNRMGLSFSDVVTGDPRALMLPMKAFAQQAEYRPDGRIDLDSAASVSSIVGFLTMSGVGVNMNSVNLASQMMEAITRGDMTGAESISKQLELQTTEGILTQLVERLDKIAEGTSGEVMIGLTESANSFFQAMEDNTEEMNALQEVMKNVLNNQEQLAERLARASQTMIDQLEKITGTRSTDRVAVATGEGGVRTVTREEAEASNLRELTPIQIPNNTISVGRLFNPTKEAFVYPTQNKLSEGLVAVRETGDVIGNMFNIPRYVPFSKLEETYGPNWYNFVLNEEQRQEAGFATGGFTGVGNRLEPAGIVHGGEYVISDNNVSGNRGTLERMQSGEKFDEFSFSSEASGDTIRVTMEFSNVNPNDIINAAKISARQVLHEERLI